MESPGCRLEVAAAVSELRSNSSRVSSVPVGFGKPAKCAHFERLVTLTKY